MTTADVAAVAGGVVVAVVMWHFMFRRHWRDLWFRTWVAAATLTVYVAVARWMLGDLAAVVGRVGLFDLLVGVTAGVLWILATHLGAAVIGRVAPSFIRQTADLYRLADRSTVMRVAAPLVAMAVAEELLFRGLIQARAGFLAATAIYAGVQLVEGKWTLVLAAFLGGLVWGGLYWWRDGVLAPAIAHALWTVTLTIVWPIHVSDGVSGGLSAPTGGSRRCRSRAGSS